MTFCRGITPDPSKVGSALQALHYASYYAYWRLSKNSTENPEVLGFKLSKITKMSSDNLFVEGMDICGTIHVHISDTALQRFM